MGGAERLPPFFLSFFWRAFSGAEAPLNTRAFSIMFLFKFSTHSNNNCLGFVQNAFLWLTGVQEASANLYSRQFID